MEDWHRANGSGGNEDETPENASTETLKSNGINVTSRPIFLNGELDMYIVEAESLPNMDLALERMRQLCSMFRPPCVPALRGQRPITPRSGLNLMNTCDPYLSVCLATTTVVRTWVIPNCENPLWDEQFCVPMAHPVVKVEFHVKDNDMFGAELIGVVEIRMANTTKNSRFTHEN